MKNEVVSDPLESIPMRKMNQTPEFVNGIDRAVRELKSPEMERIEKGIEKLQEKKRKELESIKKEISSRKSSIARDAGIEYSGDSDIEQALTPDQIQRLESYNLLIFKERQRLRDAKLRLYESRIPTLDKDIQATEKKAADAERLLSEARKDWHRGMLTRQTMNREIERIKKTDIQYRPASGDDYYKSKQTQELVINY